MDAGFDGQVAKLHCSGVDQLGDLVNALTSVTTLTCDIDEVTAFEANHPFHHFENDPDQFEQRNSSPIGI